MAGKGEQRGRLFFSRLSRVRVAHDAAGGVPTLSPGIGKMDGTFGNFYLQRARRYFWVSRNSYSPPLLLNVTSHH